MISNDFLKKLRAKNVERQLHWAGSDKVDVLFRAVEFAGESGEVCNAVKKLHRARNGITGNTVDEAAIMANLIDEIGDVIISLDMLANEFGIDLEEAASNKFNATSKKVNIDVYM